MPTTVSARAISGRVGLGSSLGRIEIFEEFDAQTPFVRGAGKVFGREKERIWTEGDGGPLSATRLSHNYHRSLSTGQTG